MTKNAGDIIAHGKKHSVSVTVDAANTATAVHSGGLDVYATPAMIALMERAAYECVESVLGSGQTTVGSMVNIRHLAASPLGSHITATATIESVDGRNIHFTVSASDGAGEIGAGSHTRTIITVDRFMEKAQARAQQEH
ncbi:MAG: thioesterase family protein [Defluviitaleaceae bacterium]|nr:thioesterase family protein [Defluviitaleaceae bacterium]